MIYKNPDLTPLALALAAAFLLTACGGGGGSKGGTRPDTPNPGTPTQPEPPPPAPVNPYKSPTSRNADRMTIPGGQTVLVSISDSIVNNEHSELNGVIAGYKPMSDGSAPFGKSSDANHGTAVASVVAGNTVGHSGNAKLLISHASSGGLSWPNLVSEGHVWALSQGARVINMSHGTAPAVVRVYDQVFSSLIANRGVATIGAGNDKANLTDKYFRDGQFIEGSFFSASGAAAANHSIIVGSVDRGGNLASSSAFPGESAGVQSRFLVAPGVSVTVASESGGTRTGSGTSFAAPVVAAGAATVMSLWPHMTGDQVATLLLSTASKDSPLYNRNNCGSNGAINCGYFYLGQGQLDMDAALMPQGALAIPTGDSVAGKSVAFNRSFSRLSPAFGDASGNVEAVSVAAFDDYGRDFHLPLNAMLRDSAKRGSMIGERMAAVVGQQSASVFEPVQQVSFDGTELAVQYDASGAVRKLNMSGQTNGVQWMAYSQPAQDAHSISDVAALNGMGLLSMQEDGRLDGNKPYQSGLGFAVPVAGAVTVGARYWVGHNQTALKEADQGSVSGARLEVGFSPIDALQLRFGAGSVHESNGLLGSSGSGALALNGSTTQTFSLGFDYRMDNGLSFFGRHQAGSIADAGGAHLIRSLSGGRVAESALGAAFSGDGWKLAAVASSPLRVSGATAHFDAPAGRTEDGRVITARQSVALSPSGRQHNYELAYVHELNNGGVAGVNLLRIEQPGHVRSASTEHAVMFHTGWKF